MDDIGEKRLYSLKKTAEVLGVSVQTLRNWDTSGKFKAIRTEGGHRRYASDQIAKFFKKDDE